MSAPQVIAVDLGGTKLAAGIVARDGAVAGGDRRGDRDAEERPKYYCV
jgi:predicted NBD/HSP70 family sugar kinase